MKHRIDHIALVVKSIEATVERLGVTANLEAVEEFPAEGTRELYVGDGERSGLLLLMQPTGPGPYQRALEKRGEGLHHVALRVEDIRQFSDSAQASGWLIHPTSEKLLQSCGQLWLYQPGVKTLIEVSEGEGCDEAAYIFAIRVAVNPGQENLLADLNVQGLAATTDSGSSFLLEAREIDLSNLFPEI